MPLTDLQLEDLFDRQAIADVVSRLGLMLDRKSYDDATSILTDDVVVKTSGGSSAGLEKVVDQAERNHRGVTQHVITNVLVDLRGDRAEVRANLIATFWPDPRRPDGTFAIRDQYRFDAVRTDDGWRLQRIEAVPTWRTPENPTSTDAEHLASAPA